MVSIVRDNQQHGSLHRAGSRAAGIRHYLRHQGDIDGQFRQHGNGQRGCNGCELHHAEEWKLRNGRADE